MVFFALDEVFVEMILHEKVLLDSVVKGVNLSLLRLQGFIFPLDELKALLELELQEGIVVQVFFNHASLFTIFACDDQMCIELMAVARGDRAVRIPYWGRRLKVGIPVSTSHLEARLEARLVWTSWLLRHVLAGIHCWWLGCPRHISGTLARQCKLIKLVSQVGVVLLNLLELVCRHSTSSVCVHVIEQHFELSLDELESFVVENLHLGFELLVFFLNSVEVGWFGCLTLCQLQDKLINSVPLVLLEIELPISYVLICTACQHRLLLDHVLQFCSLLLKPVVVILQHSDELLEVIDLLFVSEFDLLSIDSVVARNSSHLSQDPVLSHEVLKLVLQIVVMLLHV